MDHVANAEIIYMKVQMAEWVLWRQQVIDYLEYRREGISEELEEELEEMLYEADERAEELFEELKDW